jgi:hypothetical protein
MNTADGDDTVLYGWLGCGRKLSGKVDFIETEETDLRGLFRQSFSWKYSLTCFLLTIGNTRTMTMTNTVESKCLHCDVKMQEVGKKMFPGYS